MPDMIPYRDRDYHHIYSYHGHAWIASSTNSFQTAHVGWVKLTRVISGLQSPLGNGIMQPMKFILSIIAAIGIVKLNAMADTTRIYAGHNAIGSALYAYDSGSGRLYKGHNAIGSAAWIYDSRSGRIFRGHNAIGSAAFIYDGASCRLYVGHNAVGSATAVAAGSSPLRIFSGHNATGSAFCAVASGATTRMYRGHNATGSAAYAITGDLPAAVIVFLAEKLLD